MPTIPDPTDDDPTDSHHLLMQTRGFRHFLNATRFSLQGLGFAIREEAAFRHELAISMLLIPGAFFVGSTLLETAVLIMGVILVLAMELMNSGLEAIVDKTTPEFHELAGKAKDLGSAALFVAMAGVVVTWGLVIIQNFF